LKLSAFWSDYKVPLVAMACNLAQTCVEQGVHIVLDMKFLQSDYAWIDEQVASFTELASHYFVA
jgi:hypothetical protein